ncbi:hypothetical protein [Hominifimenecus sp. rT4P-3]|uniref:hypothetical protein n=1 Tax=Hominifimenecus sp. rT4P-3 TaxID=3242979 RepID=UPI003DA40A1C
MVCKDTVIVRGELDPKKIYQALADVAGDRTGMEITVTRVVKTEKAKEGAG